MTVVTANAVKNLLIDGTRRWYGLDLLLVTGTMAETLKVCCATRSRWTFR
jgi:hypothetical protein